MIGTNIVKKNVNKSRKVIENMKRELMISRIKNKMAL